MLAPYKDAFLKRFQQAMTHVHYLANLTDPRYYGKNLTSKQESEAEAWITEHYPALLPGLMALKIKDDATFTASVFTQELVDTFTPSNGGF